MEPFLGQIMAVGFNFAPRGWATCAGQLLAISQYSALFSLLGTTFGGDGRTTFGLPDLRGRSIVGGGMGQGPGLSDIRWGQKGGTETHTITMAQMPPHTHNIAINTQDGEESGPAGKYIASHGGAFAEDPVGGNLAPPATMGSGQSYNTRNPYLGMYINIALTGIYPSRN